MRARSAQQKREGNEPAEPAFIVRLAAEAIGTFALTFVAAGGDVTANRSIGPALSHGEFGPVPPDAAAKAGMG